MLSARGGYTVIEVIIVLAITGVLFGATITVFQGQQGKTSFSQSLYDLASKIQSYSGEVNSGIDHNDANLKCNTGAAGGRPQISTAGVSDDNCIVLGKAVQAETNQSQLFTYTVLGARAVNGKTSTDVDGALPTPSIDDAGAWQLVDTYTLPSDETISSSQFSDAGGTYTNGALVGMYTNLSGESSSALSVRGYPLASNATSYSSAVASCIEQAGSCSVPTQVRNWKLCLDTGGTKGSINFQASPAGLIYQVNANDGGCP